MDISSAPHHHHYNHHLHHQEMGCQSESQAAPAQQQVEKKARPAETEAQKCPRCDSLNTKFCYYNNYSLTQPRYFCKNCRRYWTKGGTLRNVPVGGGCRKNNKRSSSPSSASPASFSSASFLKRPHSSAQHLMSSPPPVSLFSAGLHLPYAGFNAYDNLAADCEGANVLSQHQINNGGFLNSLGINLGQNINPGYDHHQYGQMREEMMGYEAVKQEMSNEGRAFMGFPWPMGGDYGSISLGVGDLEPYRESWSGGQVGNLGLQGLINTAALI